MRELVLKMSISLDGYVCGPAREIDWIFPTMDEGATRWTVEKIWQAGVHAMGRKTYRDMAAWWPHSKEPFAPPMNEISKAVFSRGGIMGGSNDDQTTPAVIDALKAREARGDGTVVPTGEVVQSWCNPAVYSGDLRDEMIRLSKVRARRLWLMVERASHKVW